MAKEEVRKLKYYGPMWILSKAFIDFIPVVRTDPNSRKETAEKIMNHLDKSDRRRLKIHRHSYNYIFKKFKQILVL